MRIFSVPQNYNKVNNVSFGWFVDDNARDAVYDAVKVEGTDPDTQRIYTSWAKSIEKCDFFEVYTDKESGKVKGRFDKEFVKENTKDNDTYAHRFITTSLEMLKKFAILDDLSVFDNAEDVARCLRDFQRALTGTNLADECRSENPHGDASAAEWEREERINNLAD